VQKHTATESDGQFMYALPHEQLIPQLPPIAAGTPPKRRAPTKVGPTFDLVIMSLVFIWLPLLLLAGLIAGESGA
jgi:hypothetical protein